MRPLKTFGDVILGATAMGLVMSGAMAAEGDQVRQGDGGDAVAAAPDHSTPASSSPVRRVRRSPRVVDRRR